MLKIILSIAVLAVATVLILAALKPDVFQVARATRIAAPAERISGLIDDFHRWASWSPWEKMDPEMRRTFSGNASGIGAVYAWKGGSKVGEGRMEIPESSPARVMVKLDFAAPLEAHNIAEFTLAQRGGETEVSWTMDGRTSFFGKIVHVFFNMDRIVGNDFETGLANMKAQADAK